MDKLKETVRKIYQESDNRAVFGPRDTSLPPEWTKFFKARGLRKQETEVEEVEEKPEILAQILEGIIERIEGIETRLELLEALEDEVGQMPGDETVRKSEGIEPDIVLRRLELAGLVGKLIDRKGRKWTSSYIPSF